MQAPSAQKKSMKLPNEVMTDLEPLTSKMKFCKGKERATQNQTDNQPPQFLGTVELSQHFHTVMLALNSRSWGCFGWAAKVCLPGIPEQTDGAAILLRALACGNGEY